MKPEDIAKIAHEINKAYCESIGDNTQVDWEIAPDWQKESALHGVLMHISNPDSTPMDSHNSWWGEKVADGWKYGKVKDPEKKEHPCCIPFSELPKEQQAKDFIFRQVVKSLEEFLR